MCWGINRKGRCCLHCWHILVAACKVAYLYAETWKGLLERIVVGVWWGLGGILCRYVLLFIYVLFFLCILSLTLSATSICTPLTAYCVLLVLIIIYANFFPQSFLFNDMSSVACPGCKHHFTHACYSCHLSMTACASCHALYGCDLDRSVIHHSSSVSSPGYDDLSGNIGPEYANPGEYFC